MSRKQKINIMEDILSQFNADNLDIKLTSEKLFINTAASNEAFALRSVNGVGVIDLVDDYNKALTIWKKKSNAPYWLFILGGIFLLNGIVGKSESMAGGIMLGLAAIGGGYFLLNKSKKEKPNLMSAVRIMMSGGNRDFQFDKTGSGSGNIAEFVAKVESTLTSYHKNNG
jgi:hypothetical protein